MTSPITPSPSTSSPTMVPPAASPQGMIRLDGVSRRWPEFAIRDVRLDVAAGEYLVVVGPTGAGKSLLLELLLGIHAPDAGRIVIDGIDVTALPPERRGIGMVYQDYALFPHLEVAHNLAFGLRYRRLPRAEQRRRAHGVAELLGITHLLHRRPATLSGGERQRVALGRAMVIEPRVLLLDEPLSALDRGTAERLRGELAALHRDRAPTVIHVTHDLAEARRMGGRIVLLHDGAVHGIGTADELLRRPPTLFAARFVGAVNLFEATVATRNGQACAVIGPIAAVLPPGARDAHVLVHADEVTLGGDLAACNAPNVVRGEIAALRDDGHHIAVQLRVGGLVEPLTVFVPRHALRNDELRLGREVTADLRHALHVITDRGEVDAVGAVP